MISESVFLFQDDSRVRRLVSKGGRGLGPPRHDEKGNDGIENITCGRKLGLVSCRCPVLNRGEKGQSSMLISSSTRAAGD